MLKFRKFHPDWYLDWNAPIAMDFSPLFLLGLPLSLAGEMKATNAPGKCKCNTQEKKKLDKLKKVDPLNIPVTGKEQPSRVLNRRGTRVRLEPDSTKLHSHPPLCLLVYMRASHPV